MPMTVKARKWVTSRPEVVALVADESRWWVGAHELAAVDLHGHEAARWSFGRRPDRHQHAVAVEVVDLLELGQHAGARRFRAGGAQGLHEQAGRLPTVG